ncbi:hypothetical protein Y032_0708g1715 [Ancylostoma ceylanicum]|uniref:Uncharacterized protein n=1 Tax=Ancylostoma ceylanicum TaxID=53326 RepID=A0A016WH45_9BILA|nr:hypothetical protein Y032_0708g1715 [Ancylostoma ceylanicum]
MTRTERGLYNTSDQAISRSTSLSSSLLLISGPCLFISTASLIFLPKVRVKFRCRTTTLNFGARSFVCLNIRCSLMGRMRGL